MLTDLQTRFVKPVLIWCMWVASALVPSMGVGIVHKTWVAPHLSKTPIIGLIAVTWVTFYWGYQAYSFRRCLAELHREGIWSFSSVTHFWLMVSLEWIVTPIALASGLYAARRMGQTDPSFFYRAFVAGLLVAWLVGHFKVRAIVHRAARSDAHTMAIDASGD